MVITMISAESGTTCDSWLEREAMLNDHGYRGIHQYAADVGRNREARLLRTLCVLCPQKMSFTTQRVLM